MTRLIPTSIFHIPQPHLCPATGNLFLKLLTDLLDVWKKQIHRDWKQGRDYQELGGEGDGEIII